MRGKRGHKSQPACSGLYHFGGEGERGQVQDRVCVCVCVVVLLWPPVIMYNLQKGGTKSKFLICALSLRSPSVIYRLVRGGGHKVEPAAIPTSWAH